MVRLDLLSQEGTTQGDLLAMAIYAIAITPLIDHLEDESVKQIWYADDATAFGKIRKLKPWWDQITNKALTMNTSQMQKPGLS